MAPDCIVKSLVSVAEREPFDTIVIQLIVLVGCNGAQPVVFQRTQSESKPDLHEKPAQESRGSARRPSNRFLSVPLLNIGHGYRSPALRRLATSSRVARLLVVCTFLVMLWPGERIAAVPREPRPAPGQEAFVPTEVVGIQLFLMNVLSPLSRGEHLTPEQYQVVQLL